MLWLGCHCGKSGASYPCIWLQKLSFPNKERDFALGKNVRQEQGELVSTRILGLSEANAKTILSRARLRMRDELAPGFEGAWEERTKRSDPSDGIARALAVPSREQQMEFEG